MHVCCSGWDKHIVLLRLGQKTLQLGPFLAAGHSRRNHQSNWSPSPKLFWGQRRGRQLAGLRRHR